MQPIRTNRQLRRPDDGGIVGLAFRDDLVARSDFPVHRGRRGLAQLGPGALTGPNHHRLVKKPVGYPNPAGRRG